MRIALPIAMRFLFPLPPGEGQGEGRRRRRRRQTLCTKVEGFLVRRPSPQPSPGGRGGTLESTLVVLAIFLSGCTVGPNYAPQQTSMPEHWIPPTTAPTTRQSVATTEPADVAQWWTVF